MVAIFQAGSTTGVTGTGTTFVFTTATTLGHTPATRNLVTVTIQRPVESAVTAPAGFLLASSVFSAVLVSQIDVYWREITGSEALTYTWTFSSTVARYAVTEFTPPSATTTWHPVSAVADRGANSSVTTRNIGSVDFYFNDSVAIACVALGAARTGFAISGWTNLTSGSQITHNAYLIGGTANSGTVQPSWTTGTTVLDASVVIFSAREGFHTTVPGSYTVNAPAGAVSATVTLAGARGGFGSTAIAGTYEVPGNGGVVVYDIPISGGQAASGAIGGVGADAVALVGGSSGSGGNGGNGGTSAAAGGEGGAHSTMLVAGASKAVAGAGGGSAGHNGSGGAGFGTLGAGGAGGATTGAAGGAGASVSGFGGQGGTPSAGGAGGTGSAGTDGSAGASLAGGAGAANTTTFFSGAGGGGAGFFGGGGGEAGANSTNAGGGGGGSSQTDAAATNVTHYQGRNTLLTGWVDIQWTINTDDPFQMIA